MHSSKLLTTLRKMETNRLKGLDQYIRLAADSETTQLLPFWEIIYQAKPEFNSKYLSKAAIHEVLFPQIKFKDKRIRELISSIFRLTKQYLAECELNNRAHHRELLCLSQFRKMGLTQVFQMHWNRIQKALDVKPYRDADYHMNCYELANEANGFYGHQQIRVLDDSLQQKMYHLDAWYLSMKLKESCEMLNRQRLLNTSYLNPLAEKLIHFLETEDHSYWKIPAVQIYYRIYQCLSDENAVHFYKLVELLQQNYELFQADEARGMFKHAQNYCIRQINGGKTTFYKDLLQLYQYQLEKGIIFENGQLAHTDFKNVVTGGLRLNEFEWVKHFLETYKDKIDNRYRDNVYNLSLASYYLETGQASAAISLLKKVIFTDVFYDISARHLLLKIYFEKKEVESARYHIEAFRNFLKRNKSISNQTRAMHDNSLKFAYQLLRLNEKKLLMKKAQWMNEIEKLEYALENTSPMANKVWLYAEIQQLKASLAI